jgi:FAD-linked oxidoreductase
MRAIPTRSPARPAPGIWRSWSGLSVARPAQVLAPRDPGDVVDAVVVARHAGLRVRMAGSGHSFTDAALTDGLLLLPERLSGVTEVDPRAGTVTALAGTPLRVLNAELDRHGLALHNLGDIDRQTVAGAIATGTHGTGGRHASLSAQVCALEIVRADGSVVRLEEGGSHGDLLDAARVSLGALGVVTTVTFRVEPSFTLAADEEAMRFDDALERYDALVEDNDHVDLYWFPHTDRVLVKRHNRTTEPPAPLGRMRGWVEDELLTNTAFGWLNRAGNAAPRLVPPLNRFAARVQGSRSYRDASHRVLVSSRRVVFKEMEYAVPRAAGVPALREVRARIDRAGWRIGFPVEVRCTPNDGAWLSTAYRRPSVYLAFHVNAQADHRAYFTGVEEVLRQVGGRPHWGKLHTRTAEDLAPAYPRFADFLRVRRSHDPDGVFTNPYLERVLGR